MNKYRHEIKYIINTREAEILKNRLKMIMTPDFHGIDGYFIRSLYFDTPDNLYYYEKISGVEYRKKYRIRLYDRNDSYIVLEKKCKDNNMTYKRQAKISKLDVDRILSGKGIENNDPLIKEFEREIKIHGLRPSVIVDYNRYALTYPISDVRITFDSNIKSGIYNYDLFNYNSCYDVCDENTLVLEVKYNEILPEAIAIILGTCNIGRTSFSKFAKCRGIK